MPVFAFPKAVFYINGSGGNQDVQMRMKPQSPGMGMQDRGKSRFSSKKPFIFGLFPNGLSRSVKHCVVEESLMLPGSASETCGNSECYQEIGHRKEFENLPLEPYSGLIILANRAVAVTTGAGQNFHSMTIGTCGKKGSGFGSSACENGMNRTIMAGKKPGLIFLQEVREKFLEKIGDFHASGRSS